METPLKVACALLEDSGRVLIARRKRGLSNAGLWEFPGGKVEPGESDRACLIREFMEEFALEIEAGGFFMESAPAGSGILLRAYFARPIGQFRHLQDHDSLVLVSPAGLGAYALSPADKPIAERLAASGFPPSLADGEINN